MPASTTMSLKVTVRMYSQILGDCFLIRLTSGAKRSHILIDCGVLQGVPEAADRMRAIMENIRKDTGGKLDLVVVTHEHHDHISGFAHARDLFFDASLEVDHVWMGWTEDPNDPQAGKLDARFNVAKKALAAAAARAVALGLDPKDTAADLDEFCAPVELGVAGGERWTGRMIMERIKAKPSSPPRFLEPGTVLQTPGQVSLKAHVLGPPRNEERLFHDLPSRGDAKETYLDRVRGADGLMRQEAPFPEHYSIPFEAAREGAGEAAQWLKARYLEGDDWRLIDGDWLGAAGPLALKLDSDTNNTSLAMAFETPDGRVLLFAADAQVGNWLSWHDQDYEGTSAADLLSRTVLYKVGHHASHNATLERDGLELMESDELVAMIPVVEAVAQQQGRKGWKMPYPHLYTRLLEKTQNRVLRGDAEVGHNPDGQPLVDLHGRPLPVDPTFKARVHSQTPPHPKLGSLYVEYDVII